MYEQRKLQAPATSTEEILHAVVDELRRLNELLVTVAQKPAAKPAEIAPQHTMNPAGDTVELREPTKPAEDTTEKPASTDRAGWKPLEQPKKVTGRKASEAG